jgi:hypothetical protein
MLVSHQMVMRVRSACLSAHVVGLTPSSLSNQTPATINNDTTELKERNNYLDEIDEVLEACVEMSFLSKRNNLCRKIGLYLNFQMFDFTNLLEMLVVDVSINSEETFENGFRNGKEVFRK